MFYALAADDTVPSYLLQHSENQFIPLGLGISLSVRTQQVQRHQHRVMMGYDDSPLQKACEGTNNFEVVSI